MKLLKYALIIIYVYYKYIFIDVKLRKVSTKITNHITLNISLIAKG